MEGQSSSETVCFVCKLEIIDDPINVTRGLANLIEISKEREDNYHLLLQDKSSVLMHKNCRQRYIMKRANVLRYVDLTPAVPKPFSHLLSPKKKKGRISESFDLSRACLFCGSSHSTAKDPLRLVQNSEYGEELMTMIKKNIAHEECKTVLDRISTEDLVAATAKYHKNCRGHFHYLFSKDASSLRYRGRPVEDRKLVQFQKIVDHIEETGESSYKMNELYTIGGNLTIFWLNFQGGD